MAVPWRGTRGICKDDFRERAGRLGKRGRPWRFSLLARIVGALVGSTHAYLSGFFVGCENMRTPRISMIAMDARDPAKAFVRVPDEPGRWIYADRCVVEVPCPFCESAIGEPCKNHRTGKYWVDSHFYRRRAWLKKRPGYSHGEIHEEDVRPRIRLYADMGGSNGR